MKPFTYERVDEPQSAVQSAARPGAKYLAGGTNLVDLMRHSVESPDLLVDVAGLSDEVSEQADGSLLIGAATRNSAVANDRLVRTRYPMLARAIVAGASPQIRNVATVGGNILQRTRCPYFYDAKGTRCNKRNPGDGCDALEGFNRGHAILGASTQCVAVHPSDMCVALAALDAVVHVHGQDGKRRITFNELYPLTPERPDIETVLAPGDLITAVEIPALAFAARSVYRKIRDRSSYAFALVSVAGAIDVTHDRVADVRLALGGVAHKPWRATEAENALRGEPATHDAFRAAAELAFADASPLRDNGFKIELGKRTMVAVLTELTGKTA